MRYTIVILCSLILLLAESADAQTYYIRDIWTDNPLNGVRVVAANDTVFSNEQGVVHVDTRIAGKSAVQFEKQGFFDLKILLIDLESPIIYLTPVNQINHITVTGFRETGKPLRLPSHITRIAIDRNRMNTDQNAADIAAEQAGIFMKSYGPSGQLQSISMRGMSPEQTQVLFDGIPMNNLQLGSVDLGYFPLQQIGSMDIYRGGNALFGGSGSIGGSIDLHPAPLSDKKGYYISNSYNSLKAFVFNGAVDLPVGRYQQKVFFNYADAHNEYKTDYNGQSVKLNNRDYRQTTLGYQNAFSLMHNLTVNGYFSGFKYNGGSPGAFTNPLKERDNTARNYTENYLVKIQLKYHVQGFNTGFQIYRRDEQMIYRDTSINLNTEALRSVHSGDETGIQFRMNYLVLNSLMINAGLEGAWQNINSTEAGKHARQRGAFYLLGDLELFSSPGFFQSAHLNTAMRGEYFSNYGDVYLPGLSLNLSGNNWQLYATAAKNYRIPTFNELYWQPGGNTDLEPEESLNLESGIDYDRTFGDLLDFNMHSAVYHNRVRNQIKWLPDESIWTPQNIVEVTGRGIELEASVSGLKKLHQLTFNYRYGISEKQKQEFSGDATVGNQLPFLPREQWYLSAQTGWRKFRIGFRQSAVSFRYKSISNEPENILPAYSITDLWCGFRFNLNDHKIVLSLAVDNLWNEKYEVMAGYPMPPRNYTFGISSGLD